MILDFRTGRKFRRENATAAAKGKTTETSNVDNLVHHRSICTFPTLNNSKFSEEFVFSGILGLCAFVEAFPYDVPPFLPPILMELSTHLNDPQVINEA